MRTNILSAVALTGALIVGGFAATTSAQAGGRLDVRIDGPGFYFDSGFHKRFKKRRHFQRRCHPHKALRKARKRFGVRHAYVARVGRRGVIVSGRKWGDRVIVGFGRHRSCPVRFVRAR